MSYMYMVNMYDERSANATEHAPLHTLQINSTRTLSESSSPDVYGVVVVLDSAGPLIRDTYADQVDDALGMTFLTDITRVNQEGQLDVHLPVGEVQFVESLSTQPEPGTAVLVRLTGGSNEFQRWYEVISPEQIQEIN